MTSGLIYFFNLLVFFIMIFIFRCKSINRSATQSINTFTYSQRRKCY